MSKSALSLPWRIRSSTFHHSRQMPTVVTGGDHVYFAHAKQGGASIGRRSGARDRNHGHRRSSGRRPHRWNEMADEESFMSRSAHGSIVTHSQLTRRWARIVILVR